MDSSSWRGFKIRPDNFPLHLPGAYRYLHLESGKSYVGITQNIAKRKHDENSGARKFANAIRKYGRSSFVYEPLFYLTDGKIDRNWLCCLESKLINTFDSVNNGYNIKVADGGVGPYGPEFNALIKSYWDRLSLKDRISRLPKVEDCRKGGLATNKEKDSDGKSIWAKRTGKSRGRNGGFARAKSLSAEELRDIGRKGGLSGGRKGGLAARARLTVEEAFILSSKGGLKAHSIKDENGKSVLAQRIGKISSLNRDPKEHSASSRKGGLFKPSEETKIKMRAAAFKREAMRREATSKRNESNA